MRKLLLAFLSLLLLSACQRNQALVEAEALLEADPASALDLLEGLDREGLSAREQATFDELKATAFYRTYYFLDDDATVALQRAFRYKERSRYREELLILFLLAVMATLVLYLWARKAQTEKLLALEREENERVMTIAEDLRSRLGVLEKNREKKAAAPFAGMDMLDRLCEQYYVYEGTSNLQPKILKEVRSIVEGLRSDPKVQKSLEQSLDEGCDGVMKRLRAAFPKWKEEDFLLYAFSASGFSSTTISTLLGKDKPYVYNRVYRLKERIKAADSPDKDFFLSCIEH